MAQTPEKKVKDWVKKCILEAFPDAYWYMPVPMGFGRKGVPDILLCINGRFVAIECKAESSGVPTKLQQKNLDDVDKAGGLAFTMAGKDQSLMDHIISTLGKVK
jgi:hypothetical protein